MTPNSGMGFIGSRDTKSRNHHTMSRNSVVPDFTRTSSSLEDDTGGIHVHVEHEVIKMDYESGVSPLLHFVHRSHLTSIQRMSPSTLTEKRLGTRCRINSYLSFLFCGLSSRRSSRFLGWVYIIVYRSLRLSLSFSFPLCTNCL